MQRLVDTLLDLPKGIKLTHNSEIRKIGDMIDRLLMMWGRLRMRSMIHVAKRVLHILNSYGITTKQFYQTLSSYVDTVQEFGVTPTFPVTAKVVEKHPKLFQDFQEVGVQFAIHGYQHIDYTQIAPNEVKHHLEAAIDVFEKNKLNWSGFRFPFLRYDDVCLRLLDETGYSWDSSYVINWPLLKRDQFRDTRWQSYETMLKSYKTVDGNSTYALPEMRGNLVEIPVSVPDDDILIERLDIRDDDALYNILQKNMEMVRDQEGMLTLQLHPERFPYFHHPLKGCIQSAKQNEHVWIPTLNNISKWWRDKQSFRFEVKKIRKKKYKITANCDSKTTILVRSDEMRGERSNLWNNAFKIDEYSWEMKSATKPVIGVEPNAIDQVGSFLLGEGFAFECIEQDQEYSFLVEAQKSFDNTEKKKLLDSINQSTKPLIRFWRWPHESKYCLCISGDIDCVTIGDFGERLNG